MRKFQTQGGVIMQQRYSRGSQRFPLWIVLGVALLIVVGAFIISQFTRDKSPPTPVGQPTRISRVNLIIQSNVVGAEVYLNGQQKTMTSTSRQEVMLFNLAPKTYQITLKKQGYADRSQTVEITGQTISQTVRIDMQSGVTTE